MAIRDESAHGEVGAVKAFLAGRNDNTKSSIERPIATSRDGRVSFLSPRHTKTKLIHDALCGRLSYAVAHHLINACGLRHE